MVGLSTLSRRKQGLDVTDNKTGNKIVNWRDLKQINRLNYVPTTSNGSGKTQLEFESYMTPHWVCPFNCRRDDFNYLTLTSPSNKSGSSDHKSHLQPDNRVWSVSPTHQQVRRNAVPAPQSLTQSHYDPIKFLLGKVETLTQDTVSGITLNLL